MRKKIMGDHLFIDQKLSTLQGEIYGSKSAFYKRLYEQCRKYFSETLPEEHPLRTITYMGIASANLSLMFLITNQPAFLTEAKRWINACLRYPHWGHGKDADVDLSAAWLLFGLGLSYDWLKSSMSEEERAALRDRLALQATRMYEYKLSTEGRGWSTNFWQNHNWINLTGLAAAGYALVDEVPEAQTWIDAAKGNFEYVYSVLPEDGSDYEGTCYWRYGAMWLYIYAHLLKEREGINYFETCDFLRNSFYYRLYQSAPNLEEQINFGDCHDRRSGHSTAIYYKTAAEYRNGHAQKMGNLVVEKFLYGEALESGVRPGILPECLFELLFYDPAVPEQDFGGLPLEKFFDDLGVLAIRSSWEQDAIHFTFKCSQPGGKKQWANLWKLKQDKGYDSFGLSHQHPDNNSFILVANDTYLAIDEGYNRSSQAAKHNTVLVDGAGFEGEGTKNFWRYYSPEMVGTIEKYLNQEALVYVVGETARTYQKDLALTRFARHVLFTRKSFFVILDELISDLDHSYTWVLHSDVFPSMQAGGYYYQNGPGEMKLYPVFPPNPIVDFRENIVRDYMTPQQPDEYRQINMKTLYLSTPEKTKSAFFLNVLAVGSQRDEIDVQVTPVSEEGQIGVVVKSGDEVEAFLYSQAGKVRFRGREFAAREVFVREKDDQVLEEILL